MDNDESSETHKSTDTSTHDLYGKRVIEAAAGHQFNGTRKACRVDYGGPLHTGGFIDGTAAGMIAIEVESRVPKQIRGAVLDLLCHSYPKKLLVIIRAHPPKPKLTSSQCKCYGVFYIGVEFSSRNFRRYWRKVAI